MARRPRPRKSPETYQTYVFEVADWEPSFHLSLSNSKLRDDLYWEHLSVRIFAGCTFPQRLAGKPPQIDLVADRDLPNPSVLKYDEDWNRMTDI